MLWESYNWSIALNCTVEQLDSTFSCSPVVDSVNTEISAILEPHDDFMIGEKLSKPGSKPPTAIRLLKQLPDNKYCYTVCRHKGVTYVGLEDGSINRIDASGKLTAAFIKLPREILTIRAYQDRLYILLSKQSSIHIYNLEGQNVSSWEHADTAGSYVGNKLCIISGQICVNDISNRRITVYDLNGKVLKHIRCSSLAEGAINASLCWAGDSCVMITAYNPPRVFKFNLETKTVLWTKSLSKTPYCVASTSRAVLVSGDGRSGIWISVLNPQNGLCLSVSFTTLTYIDLLIIPISVPKLYV